MKVIIKNFPRYFYINENIRENTKDHVIAKLWFHLGDNVTVCSNLTGEVLDEWRHVDPNEPSVKKALEIADRYNARGISVRWGILGFFISAEKSIACNKDLCNSKLDPGISEELYGSDLEPISNSTNTDEFYIWFSVDLSKLG